MKIKDDRSALLRHCLNFGRRPRLELSACRKEGLTAAAFFFYVPAWIPIRCCNPFAGRTRRGHLFFIDHTLASMLWHLASGRVVIIFRRNRAPAKDGRGLRDGGGREGSRRVVFFLGV